jgi:hypothetical protein
LTATNLLVALILVALWYVLWSSWLLRNWRATSLGLAVTGAILAAGLLPVAISPWIRGGLWGGAMLVFLTKTERFAAIPPAECRFVEDYVRVLRSLRRLKERALETDPATHISRYESAVASLERIEAPGDWAQLQADTVGELNRRLVMMKLLVRPSVDVQRAGEARWLEIEGRFDAMIKRKAGFWSGWPPSAPRSD